MPATGEGTSTETLSVSSSHSISSWATASPSFLNQVETVASVTLSPSVGTITSVILPSWGCGAVVAPGLGEGSAGRVPASVISASKAATPTVVPSGATMAAKMPDTGAGTSTVTLSVSNSHSISSAATASPGFLNQVATVASETLSPRVGTRTSTVMRYFPAPRGHR